MINAKRFLALLTLFLLAIALAACGEAEEVYGKIIKIASDNITIETGVFLNASEGQACSFASDGGSAIYALSSNIDTEKLTENMIVKLTLQDETVTAVETEVDEAETTPETTDSGAEAGTTELSAALTFDGKKQDLSGKQYDSSQPDVSTILLKNKASLTLSNCTLTKSGDASGNDESSAHGLNAVLTASGESRATLTAATLTSSGNGANAIFSTGKGTKVSASDFKIYTTGDSSRGLFAASGGNISASGGDITTKGDLCAPISAGKGESSIQIQDTTVSSEGKRSPCLYSAGTITASGISGSAAGSQIALINGNSNVTLNDCLLQGAGKSGIALFETGSKADSAENASGEASLNIVDSKLTTTSEGPMFYVTNTRGSVTLKNTSIYYSNGVLAKVAGNKTGKWGTPGKNGGTFTLKGIHQTLSGNITCDSISTVAVKLTKNSLFQGTLNAKNTAKSASISLDKTSRWEVTGDSYVSKITDKNTKCRNIRSNGHTVYYDAAQKGNGWLKGKTISLPGGGKLTPAP